MVPISNIDRLVLLLRQRLSERGRRPAPSEVNRATSSRRVAGPSALRALAGVDGVEGRHLRRALIQDLLADSFGEQAVNDADFQRIVERVTDAIEAEPAAARLLERVVGEVTGAAR